MNSKINIPKAFFSFLIASFLMWVLINLSKEYTTIFSYKVVYRAIAQNKILQEAPLEEIDIEVKGSGFKLIVTNFTNRELELSANKLQKNTKNYYYFLPRRQELEIQKQLKSGLKLEKVIQDTLFLRLGSLLSKKVPVLTNIGLDFKRGYDLLNPIKVQPDSVLISGTAAQIQNITNVFTENITLKDVFENQEKTLKIEKPQDLEKIKLSSTQVKVLIEVDKFTEGEFYVPFSIENLPYGTDINTYPKKVKVVFKVGLNNFNKISKNSFKIVCDYRDSKENDLSYLVPKLKIGSSLVSSVRIVPNKIDFLIQK